MALMRLSGGEDGVLFCYDYHHLWSALYLHQSMAGAAHIHTEWMHLCIQAGKSLL